jgi:hypothetical protein
MKVIKRKVLNHVRGASAALASVLCVLPNWAQAADSYPLCGIDRQQFAKFAYPAGVPHFDHKLIKWPQSPGLIVLSPDAQWEEKSEQLLDQIGNDGVPPPSLIKFVHYNTPAEIREAPETYGVNNVFVAIDGAGFNEKPETDDLRQALADVLISPKLADRLVADGLRTKQWAVQSHMNAESGETYVSAALINPALNQEAVLHAIYTLYYAALSPPATYRVRDFFDAMFVSDGNHLSDFAKAYYRIVMDPNVPTGVAPDQFDACNG